eukprot:1090014-Rhodomonas_salina.3
MSALPASTGHCVGRVYASTGHCVGRAYGSTGQRVGRGSRDLRSDTCELFGHDRAPRQPLSWAPLPL